jgi:5-methyltetrahydrofolate--homocysteine methyltransferase
MAMSGFLHALADRVIIFDGAAGTTLQAADLDADDFGGEQYEGCNEILNVTRPDVIATMHDSFLAVGVDVIETNTFGGFSVPLAEYGLADRAYELNKAAAEIAVAAASRHSTYDHQRWVAGSIGPGTKLPSLGQITYRELVGAYQTQARGLLDGGCDLLIIETMYDLLTLKAAVTGSRRAMAECGRTIPIQAQVTIETTGRMLPGTEISAALAAIEPLRVDVIGLNCATGPEEMEEHLRYLARHSRVPVAAIPNAGLPEVVDGKMYYGLSPASLAEQHARFITDLGVSVVGGCCGTTPDHLRAVVARCRDLEPMQRQNQDARRCGVHLQLRSFRPGHVVSDHRGTNQRQRIQGISGGNAGGGLGCLPRGGA